MSILEVEKILQNDPAHARLAHEEKYHEGAAFIHDHYCTRDEAAIPLADNGFYQSDATYEVMSASKGLMFRLQDHLDRLERSCAKLRLHNPYSNDQMVEILTNLIKLTGTREAYIFWCVTRGFGKARSRAIDPESFENRFYASVTPSSYSNYIAGDTKRRRGMDILISRNYIRVPSQAIDSSIKNFHWLDMKLSLFEAGDQAKDWSVLTDGEGYLTEAPGANIFLIKEGELYTPSSGCLGGVTRKTALELADLAGLKTHIGKVSTEQLLTADEAFLTSTAGGIVPINSVDDVVLGGSIGPGRITTQLHNTYWEKRWSGWLGTPIDGELTIAI